MINPQLVYHKKLLSLSVWQYILRLTLLMLIVYVCFFLFGDNSGPLLSFISSSFVFLLATVFATLILFKDTKWITFFVYVYIIKVLIGLAHYLFFIDANYFKGNGEYKALTFEFDAVFRGINKFAALKLEHGLFYFDANAIEATHPEMLSFISIPFMFLGDFVLSISPINTFFSLLISINILLIAKYKYNFNNKRLKYIALITAYFPITFISSYLWRDVIGISLMSIGLTMLCFTKRSLTQFLILLIACYLFYIHRTIYPVLLVLAFTLEILYNNKSKNNKLDSLYRLFTIGLMVLSTPLVYFLANTEANTNMASGILNFNLLVLPIKIILGLIGPFPWTNFLLYETIPAYAYQLQDYLQGTFNIAFLIIMFRNKFFRKENLNLLCIIGFFLIMSGLLNSYMHMPYIAFGFMFLTPWLFSVINLKEFKRIYKFTFMSLVVLNIIVFLLGNFGFSSLWR